MPYNISKIFYSSLKFEKSSKISIFYVFRVQYLPLKGVSKRKNRHLLTFVNIKTVSGVMRSCCLFLPAPMVMKKCLQTYYGITIALENFLRSLKSSVVIRKIVTFYTILNHFVSKSGLERYETQKIINFLRFCE